MSTDNKQMMRSLYEAFQRGDIQTVLAALEPDVEWHYPGAAPYAGRYDSPQKVRQFFETLQRTVELDQFDAREFLSDGDKVMILGSSRGTVKESGRRFEQEWAHVYTIRGGKVALAHFYPDTHAEASAFGESTKERQAMGGPLGVTEPAFSGGQ